MELIVRERISPQVESLIPPPKLPTYLRVALVLVISITCVSVSIRALAQHTEPPPNPLTSFADLRPGQPGSGMEARGFTCYLEGYDYRDAGEHCFIDLPTGTFTRVALFISEDWIIRYAAFTMRENTLRLGDLMLTLGRPEIHRYGHQTTFKWPGTGIVASTHSYSAQFSAFLPVWSISFTSL